MLTDKQRQKVISKLSSQMSDNEIAEKCGVSRSTVWRIRQDETAKEAKRKRSLARMKAKEKRVAPPEVKAPPPPEPAPVEVKIAAVAPPVPEPVMPKVDVEPVTMANYFAVQILRGESVRDVAYAVMRAAEVAGVLFRKLQILDCISVGTSPFARFRSDLSDVADILRDADRGFISFSDGAYRVTFTDGRQVKYPTTVLCSVQKSGFGQTFAGPKIARWAQQFQPRGN